MAHPYWIRSAYAVSWIYLAGDVSNETYKAYLKNQETLHKPPLSQTPNSAESFAKAKATDNPDGVPLLQDYRLVGVQRAVFQTLASMALPVSQNRRCLVVVIYTSIDFSWAGVHDTLHGQICR